MLYHSFVTVGEEQVEGREKRITNMRQAVYIILFFITACVNKKIQHDEDAYFSFWIKGIVTDSVHRETGSLLAEPFSRRSNSLPDIVYLSSRKIYSGSRDSNVRSMFDVKDSLIVEELSMKEIDVLEEMKFISRDSSILNSSSVNPLGTIYINQILRNKENAIIYIDHSYSGKHQNHYFSAISELHFNDGKWILVRTEVYEMS